MSSISSRKSDYTSAVERAMLWLVRHQEADGSFGAVETMSHYMLLGASLMEGGHPAAAQKLMPALSRLFVRPQGGFDPPEVRAGRASALQERGYAPGWMIYSAHLNRAFDISLRAMPQLLALQDPASGGMFGREEDAQTGKGIINTAVTCVACQSAVATGHIAEAERMGRHLLLNVFGANRELSQAFYPIWDTERGLRTDAQAPVSPNMPAVIRRNQPNQHHFLTGMMIGAFTDLYRVTRDGAYLDAAVEMFRFGVEGNPAVYESTASHKLAWGCATLYRETGDRAHLEAACRLCDYLVGLQEQDGSFVHWAFVKTSADWPYSPRLNITAQFALWISRTLHCL